MSSETATALHLHEIKGLLTKFMRMLYPLEFRMDSIANFAAALPLRYPIGPGEMIHLPESIDGLASREDAYEYYLVVAAHLAGRHEFGTFELRLADLAGFEERHETGVEALASFVSSFKDPTLAGALMRVCEAARIDAAISLRYQGLAPRIAHVNRTLTAAMAPQALGTTLIRTALDLNSSEEIALNGFIQRAQSFFIPLRSEGATVLASARQTLALYEWFEELVKMAAAADRDQMGGEGLSRDELARAFGDGAQMLDGEGQDEGDINPGDGSEPNQNVRMQLSGKRSKGGGGESLSPEELQKLLEQGAELKPAQADGPGSGGGEGMYLTQLQGKLMGLEELREQLAEAGSVSGHGHLVMGARAGEQDSYYAYDEWDYVAGDYRRNWCRLREIPLAGDDGGFYSRTLERYAELLPQVRHHFQRIRPASYRMVRGLEDGEEIDLDRTVEARVARRMGQSPETRLYKARKKEARDVATLFLLDMSASTDEPIQREPRRYTDDDDTDDWLKAWQRRPAAAERPRRIIDVNKEALVIMAQALEEIGDSYAIMGFSGHGRDNVEFYVIKEFDNQLTDDVRGRVGAVEPKRSTRMGTAIRHVREKFKDVSCRSRHMILLSDGFPQDFDYGQDRRSNTYGIQDTMIALKELEMAGVMPFCITVDRTGHDYLREMCQSSRYLVIDDITALPRELPKIYEQIVRW